MSAVGIPVLLAFAAVQVVVAVAMAIEDQRHQPAPIRRENSTPPTIANSHRRELRRRPGPAAAANEIAGARSTNSGITIRARASSTYRSAERHCQVTCLGNRERSHATAIDPPRSALTPASDGEGSIVGPSCPWAGLVIGGLGRHRRIVERRPRRRVERARRLRFAGANCPCARLPARLRPRRVPCARAAAPS